MIPKIQKYQNYSDRRYYPPTRRGKNAFSKYKGVDEWHALQQIKSEVIAREEEEKILEKRAKQKQLK